MRTLAPLIKQSVKDMLTKRWLQTTKTLSTFEKKSECGSANLKLDPVYLLWIMDLL